MMTTVVQSILQKTILPTSFLHSPWVHLTQCSVSILSYNPPAQLQIAKGWKTLKMLPVLQDQVFSYDLILHEKNKQVHPY